MRIFVTLMLASLAFACRADTVDRPTGESAAAFASRYAPNGQSEVVRVGEYRAWDYGSPLILAFYEYPVTLADPARNYGPDPNDHEVLGYVFVPTSATRYERIEVDGFGPEGANAQVVGVAFVSRPNAPAVLRLRISWRNTHGEYVRVCSYAKPRIDQHPKKLLRLKSAKCNT